jgi:replicative DNA helicase
MSVEEITENLAASLGASFSGDGDKSSVISNADEEVPNQPYDFDESFQDQIMAFAISDHVFARRTVGLVKPDYFENQASATLVAIAQAHYQKYKELPDIAAFKQILRTKIESGMIRADMKGEVIGKFKEVFQKGGKLNKLVNRAYIVDQVEEFARHQEIYKVTLKIPDLMAKGKHDEIAKLMKKASMIGQNMADHVIDYFANIEERSVIRKEKAAGLRPPQGITTGVKKLDDMLYHGGWGFEELSLLLGGAKAGKSTGLLWFAKNAALAGHDTLYVTMEMSADIAMNRMDASISGVEMTNLTKAIGEVEEKVKEAHKKAGRLMVAQFPTGTLTPSGLRRLLESLAADGQRFKLVVLDYMDLMRPDVITQNSIENSKNIYIDVRAIAQEEHIAILSATQTNREGFKSVTAKAEHVSDDFNKIRIADLLISINATEDEQNRNEARLFLLPSRNQKGNIMLQVQYDLERMIFIKRVIAVI